MALCREYGWDYRNGAISLGGAELSDSISGGGGGGGGEMWAISGHS